MTIRKVTRGPNTHPSDKYRTKGITKDVRHTPPGPRNPAHRRSKAALARQGR